MSGKKSRNKGASFEREVAAIFAEWSGGLEICRTPLSGGWARQNPAVSGDLVNITPDTVFPLHIECKKQEGWTLEAILQGHCAQFDSWWEQTITTCPKNKLPLLVFSRNYHAIWCAGWREHWDVSELYNYCIIEEKVIIQFENWLEAYSLGGIILWLNNLSSITTT